MKNVEKALQKHLQDVIKDKYLESLVDEDTQLIQEKSQQYYNFYSTLTEKYHQRK